MGNDTSEARKDGSEQEDCHENNEKWLQIVKNGQNRSYLRRTCVIDSKIPRPMVSLDEKYLRRCLELIHISASKSARCNFSVNFIGSGKMGISSYHLDSAVIAKESIRDAPQIVLEFPSASGPTSTFIRPTVAGYKKIMHMIDKPSLHKPGASDMDSNRSTRRKDGFKGPVSYEIASSPSRYLLKITEKERMDSRVKNYESESNRKRVVSESSTNSTCFSSDKLFFSSVSSSVSQVTVQFTMNETGLPRFVFSVDDKKEIFMVNLSNESGYKIGDLDYSYLIYLQKGSSAESHLVGKIKVSTLFSVSSSSNSKVMEREFVLFSDSENLQMQCHDLIKHRGLPKKVVDAFKNTRASRQRNVSRFSRASSIPDFSSWEPFQEPDYDLEPLNLLENNHPPNFESSAVVVKEMIPEEQQEEELGGWGMKFLKKTSMTRTCDTSEDSRKPSTSMDIIIPSGIHGGPRKRIGGPSNLIQRWKSGGVCDCGGWDLGCPITLLKGEPQVDQDEGHCNVFELFIEGSKHDRPELQMVNVQDGLYIVQFQANISVLQCISIAVARIHSQSQSLRLSLA